MNRRLALAGVLVAAVVALRPARAQAQSAQDKAAAESAFEEGKRLMAVKAYPDACPKFVESIRLAPGIGAMLGLADCYEHNGQSASAWAEFLEAASAAARKGDRREALARENARRLVTALSKLIIRVPADADVDGLVVKRDGVAVGRAEWGTAVPVDPGIHAVQAGAPGWKDWQTTIHIASAPGVQTILVPHLEPPPEPPAPPPVAAVAVPTPAPAVDPRVAARARTQRLAALIAGGVGAVAVGVGAGFGIAAKVELDQSNSGGRCNAADFCTTPGLAMRQTAEDDARASTVLFAVGAVAVAGGAVLWFTAPRVTGQRVGIVPSVAGASLVGSW